MPVNGARYRLTLESGVTVPRYSAYRGSWGALRWPGAAGSGSRRRRRRQCTPSWPGASGSPSWSAGSTVPEQVELLRADKVLRDRVRDELAARGMAVADGWIED